MAYTKTVWVNGTAPAINDTNLNKIEQGIYDALRQDGTTAMSGQFVTVAGDATTPAIAPTGDANTGIYFPAAETIGLTTNGLEKIRVTSGGFVGVGTIPNSKLHVYDANAVIQINEVATGGAGVAAMRLKHGSNYMGFYLDSANALVTYDYQAGQERMRIDSTGKVGIGVTPNVILHTKSTGETLRLETTATTGDNYIRFYAPSSTTKGYVGYTSAVNDIMNVNQVANADLVLHTNNTPRLTVQAGGNVGVGVSSPSRKLEIDGSGVATPPLRLTNTSNNVGIEYIPNATYYSFLTATAYNASNTFEITPSTAAGGTTYTTPALTIRSNGNIGMSVLSSSYLLQLGVDSAAKPSTNTWTIASDERVKNVTGEYTKGLDAICSLRPVTYEYNGKAGFAVDGKENISIIAQEAIVHFPECVGTFNAKLEETDEQETELYNWNGHAITFALINAVKELKSEIESLKAQLNA